MTFTIFFNITADPEITLVKIWEEVKKLDVQCDGDAQHGTFSGYKAKGTYEVTGKRIKITVTDKPFFIPESLIKKFAAAKAPEWGLAVE